MKSPARRHAVAYATSFEVCCKDSHICAPALGVTAKIRTPFNSEPTHPLNSQLIPHKTSLIDLAFVFLLNKRA